MHLPAVADGNPHHPIAAGATWSPAWTIDQPATTLWYHPHPHRGNGDQMYRGVAGMFILSSGYAIAVICEPPLDSRCAVWSSMKSRFRRRGTTVTRRR